MNTIVEHMPFLESLNEKGLNRVLLDLCVPGTGWIVSKQDYCTINITSLKLEYCVWNHFVNTNLMPCTHHNSILKDRLLLLHSIVMVWKLNVGKLIFKKVHKCAQRTARALFFLALILALCEEVGVLMQTNEDITYNTGAILKKIAQDFLDKEMPQ